MSNYYGMFIIVFFFLIFYFIIIRPQKKKENETKKMRDSLAVGDEITTIGGVIGKVVKIKDDTLTIETGADKVKITFTKWAVSTKNTVE